MACVVCLLKGDFTATFIVGIMSLKTHIQVTYDKVLWNKGFDLVEFKPDKIL